jgi:hypothetical protein
VQFSYSEGRLIQATLAQTASQRTHMMKYVLGELMEDVTTPRQAASVLELLDTLGSADPKSPDDEGRQRVLDGVSRLVLLQPDPSQLNTQTAN